MPLLDTAISLHLLIEYDETILLRVLTPCAGFSMPRFNPPLVL